MSGFNINTFRAQALPQGGARPTNFVVTLTFPDLVNATSVGAAQQIQFVARASKLPESQLGQVPIPYFGRTIKLAGNRQYDDWSITVMNDEDFSIRNAFEAWHNAINTTVSNRLDTRVANIAPALGNSYKTTALVTQFSKEGPGDIDGDGAIKTYLFNGVFPTMITDIALDWNSVNEIEQFSVTFAYDWYEPYIKADGNPIFALELGDDA